MAKLFLVSPKDYNEIAVFLSQYEDWLEPAEFWLAQFHLWWDENSALSEDIPRGWGLRDGQKFVGFLGLIPSPFQLFGEEIIAFNGAAGYVLPEYRNQSLQLFTQFISYSKESIFFNTQPADKVVKLIKKLGFSSIPRNTYKRSFIIFDFESVLKVKLGQSFLKNIFIKICSPVFAVAQAIRLKKSDILEMKNVKRIEAADVEFDELWERTKGIYPTTNVRSAQVINWLCFTEKESGTIVFGYYQDKLLLGYAIFKVTPVQSVRILECTDFWPPGLDHVVCALINAVRDFASRENYSCVLFPHFNLELEKSCIKMGLFSVESKDRREFIKVKPEWREKINDVNSYFVIQGDRSL